MEHGGGDAAAIAAAKGFEAMDTSAVEAMVDEAIAAVDAGSGVAVVTDMFGGTPCNLAISASRPDSVEVIYGANLPMLVKLAKSRDKTLAVAAQCAVSAGVKYIDRASCMLKADAC